MTNTRRFAAALLLFGMGVPVLAQEGRSDPDFVKIPAGSFTMRTPDYTAGDIPEPVGEKQIDIPAFYLQAHETTKAEWAAVIVRARNAGISTTLSDDPSAFKTPEDAQGALRWSDYPIESVSWKEVHAFIGILNQLSALEGQGRSYRLPNEAEWEYAARADTAGLFEPLDEYAWNGEKIRLLNPQRVERKMPNPWGLYDMLGNVWEMVEPDPRVPGPAWNNTLTLARGGSWVHGAAQCTVTTRWRGKQPVTSGRYYIGFRLAMDLKDSQK